MKEISSNNENVNKLVEATFQYNKINQRNEKRNNIISDHFIAQKAHELNNSNAKKD